MASSNDDPLFNNANDDNCDGSFSYFQKTVCLYDWWLIKAENDFQGKQLAVAGLTSRERQAVRVFISAPIIKRHDVFSLETADGIHLIVRGFINEQRTKENGFPLQVLKNFIFGFPPNWLSYAVNFFEGKFTTRDDSGSILTPNGSPIDTAFACNGMEKSNLTFKLSISLVESTGNHEKPFPEARLQNIWTGCQKTLTSGGHLKHPDKELNPTEITENPNREKLKIPVTSVESQGEISMSSLQLVEESASRNLRTLPETTKGKYKTKRVLVVSLPADSKRKKITERVLVLALPADSKRKKITERVLVLALPADSKRKKIEPVSADSNSVGESLTNQFDDLEDGKRNIDGINDSFQIRCDVKQGQNCSELSLKRGVRTRSKRKSKQSPTGQTRSKRKSKQPPTRFVGADNTNHMQIAVGKDKSNSEKEMLSVKKIRKRINYDARVTPITKEGQKKISTNSPQLSSFKRSRSGRMLLPTMQFWLNQMPVYDAECTYRIHPSPPRTTKSEKSWMAHLWYHQLEEVELNLEKSEGNRYEIHMPTQKVQEVENARQDISERDDA